MADIRQTIAFYAFASKPLASLLDISSPPFARTKSPLRQLQYVEAYVKQLGCATVVVEEHYIDRDHIEDHSAFYSRNFVSYENYCQRAHFFSLDEATLRREVQVAVAAGKNGTKAYRDACEALSAKAYLGWSVIKPLHGCPVGRTILRTYPEQGDKCKRLFPSVRRHRAHILGVELPVFGLPFQQQDTGVSACATTAIWSALHHFRGVEDVAAATPAQITSIASRYSLPFGRSMPSEGLSMEQMCQAVQGMGLSPHLHRAVNYRTAQSIIFSATMSGMAPILIIDGTSEYKGQRHAVTVAGVKLADPFTPNPLDGVAEQSTQLVGAYIHDDRLGPYVSTLFENDNGTGRLRFLLRGVIEKEQVWEVSHILIPMHPKIRLSFGSLQEVALEVAKWIQWFFVKELKASADPDITVDGVVLRGYQYIEELLFERDGLGAAVEQFCSEVSLPRYVGRVRTQNPQIGTIDILVDTTGTLRNLHCSAVVCRTPNAPQASAVGEFLTKQFKAFPRVFGISKT